MYLIDFSSRMRKAKKKNGKNWNGHHQSNKSCSFSPALPSNFFLPKWSVFLCIKCVCTISGNFFVSFEFYVQKVCQPWIRVKHLNYISIAVYILTIWSVLISIIHNSFSIELLVIRFCMSSVMGINMHFMKNVVNYFFLLLLCCVGILVQSTRHSRLNTH